MLPKGPRVAVRRLDGERTLDCGIVIPVPDMRHSFVGTVVAVGEPHRIRDHRLPLDLKRGDDVLYSSRVDTFVLGDGSTVDLVEENSVIGVMQ